MQRRTLLKGLTLLPQLAGLADAAKAGATQLLRRVRPGEAGWPDSDQWAMLNKAVENRLIQVESPFVACVNDPGSAACAELFQNRTNPFFIGDNVAFTQTLGWTDAWTSEASAYAVLAQSSADVAAAADFAREHALRLVVKRGGHSDIGRNPQWRVIRAADGRRSRG